MEAGIKHNQLYLGKGYIQDVMISVPVVADLYTQAQRTRHGC
jgi:hypothetical protein